MILLVIGMVMITSWTVPRSFSISGETVNTSVASSSVAATNSISSDLKTKLEPQFRKTLISHVFNEEYLLPFWLQHHATIFDHGIIIDYQSTDKSLDLVRQYCPSWEIRTTRNIRNGLANFEAELVDREIEDIEQTIQGFKVCLNTTEFLVWDPQELDPQKHYHLLSWSVAGEPTADFYPTNIYEFFRHITVAGTHLNRGYRYLHAESHLIYSPGRHSYYGVEHCADKILRPKTMVIFHTRDYPWNEAMIQRRLQIQQNIPESDKASGRGYQHITNRDQILETHARDIQGMTPLPDHLQHLLEKYGRFIPYGLRRV